MPPGRGIPQRLAPRAEITPGDLLSPSATARSATVTLLG
jgi:hypothetical protein